MATPIVKIPKINDIKFVPNELVLPPEYNRTIDDKVWLKNSIRRWQLDPKYQQKKELTDVQDIVIAAANDTFGFVTLEIYDDCGNVIADSIDPKFTLYTSGLKETTPTGTAIPLGLYYWNFTINDYVTNAGIYYYAIRLEYVPDKIYISEPIYIRDEWPETSLIECRNLTNKGQDGIIFNFIPTIYDSYIGTFFSPTFRHRIEGDIVSYEFDSNDAQFTEQDWEERQMSSTAWKEYVLNIGGDIGVPMYLFDKLNAVFSCDYKAVNGTRFEKSNGAKWQMDNAEFYPMYNGDLSLRIYDKEDEITDRTGSTIIIFQEPTSDPVANPYYIYSLGFVGQTILAAEYIDNVSTINGLKSYVQNTVPVILNLQGVFSFTSGEWTYQNAYGEDYQPQDFKVFTQPIDIDISHTNAQTMGIVIVNDALNTIGGVVWGDGSWENYSRTGSAGALLLSKSYTGTGNKTVRLYPQDSLFGVSILRQHRTSTIQNITGMLPAGMNNFVVTCFLNKDFTALPSGTFDLGLIANARYNLRQLNMLNAAFTALDTSVFGAYPAVGFSADSNNWKLLTGISFDQCKLTASEVADFILDFYDFTPLWSTGSIELRQNPVAPLVDAQAIIYKNNLILAGWTVLTN